MGNNCCLLSYVHNEPFFFPIFLRYYSQIFEPQDIYIISNNNDYEFMYELQKNYLFTRIDLKTEYNHDFTAIHQEVNKQFAILFAKYKFVFLLECDEILYHSDGLLSACKFYERLPMPAIRCMGFEPVHDYLNGESTIDPSLPLLKQRKLWWDTKYFRKPVCLKQPIDYWYNMHNYDNNYHLIDAKLKLIHLKMIDYDVLWKRNEEALKEGNFSPETLESGKGWQNRICNKLEFDKYFSQALHFCEPIPEEYKNII